MRWTKAVTAGVLTACLVGAPAAVVAQQQQPGVRPDRPEAYPATRHVDDTDWGLLGLLGLLGLAGLLGRRMLTRDTDYIGRSADVRRDR